MSAQAGRPERPNIIFIMPDQLRADYLSCYGATFIDTPHIDSLCERGVKYTQALTPHPLCVPARVSLLTGIDALRTGVLKNARFLREDHRACGVDTWPEILSDHGYVTAATGKMHFRPWNAMLGLQHWDIAVDKTAVHLEDHYAEYLAEHGYRKLRGKDHAGYFQNKGAVTSPIPWEHSVDHWVGTRTCQFLREYDRDEPFCLMVGFPGPHPPFDPCPEFLSRYDPDDMPEPVPTVEWDAPEMRRRNLAANAHWHDHDYSEFAITQKKTLSAHYAALVAQIDHEVGRILATLQASGLDENTVVLFSSDHGEFLGDHGMVGKHSFYEAACRAPLLARLPWADGPQVCDDLVTLTDVTATLLCLAGVDVPEVMDSLPLPGLGIPCGPPRERLFGSLHDIWMAYDGRFKYVKCVTGERTLFDLDRDPQELHNLVGDTHHAHVRDRLDAELTTHVMECVGTAVFPRLAEG